MHDRDKFRTKVLLNYKFVFQFMFIIEHSIEIKLFVNHKLTFVARHTDIQTDRQTKGTNCLSPLFASHAQGNTHTNTTIPSPALSFLCELTLNHYIPLSCHMSLVTMLLVCSLPPLVYLFPSAPLLTLTSYPSFLNTKIFNISANHIPKCVSMRNKGRMSFRKEQGSINVRLVKLKLQTVTWSASLIWLRYY